MTVIRLADRRRAGQNPTYKLTELDRDHVAILHALNLWSNTAIGAAFGINRSRVPRIAATREIRT